MIDVQLGFTGDDSPCCDSCDLWSHSMLEPSEWTIQHTLRCKETCPRMAGHLVTRTLLVLRDEGSLTFCHHLQFPEKNASQTMPICKMNKPSSGLNIDCYSLTVGVPMGPFLLQQNICPRIFLELGLKYGHQTASGRAEPWREEPCGKSEHSCHWSKVGKGEVEWQGLDPPPKGCSTTFRDRILVKM